MEELEVRNSLRERILYDLKNLVKQVYHESVHNELSPENKTYICLMLIKNIDEALRHGLKQLHLGYWKPICEVLHPQTLESLERLPLYSETECNSLMKGKAWIAFSLRDESFINYIQCLVTEAGLEKYYDEWSILRTSDSCNNFLSILSGLENVTFTYDLEYINKMPICCNFVKKDESSNENNINKFNLSKKKSDSSLTSPVDSGIHIQDSTYDIEQLSDDNKNFDIDFINGNVPEPVLLRKPKKSDKRHVSFHEDIIYKNKENSRILKWDSENLRYSWSGEQIDSRIFQNSNFAEIRMSKKESDTIPKSYSINERGVPEGEETPPEKAEILVKPTMDQSCRSVNIKKYLNIRNQSRLRHNRSKRLNCTNCVWKKHKIETRLSQKVEQEIEKELSRKPAGPVFKYEVSLNLEVVKDMIHNQTIYKSYLLPDYLIIITNAYLHLINRNLEMKRMYFGHLHEAVVYPDSHAFYLWELKENGIASEPQIFVTRNAELTNEILGRLEFSMRKNLYDPPLFHMLDHEYLSFLKKPLVDQLVIGPKEEFVYSGCVRLFKQNDLFNSMLPTTKRSFLMYRLPETGKGWIPGEFHLKNGILYLFEEDKNIPKLAINIATGCRSCHRTNNPDRPHTFQISLVESNVESCNDRTRNYQDSGFKTIPFPPNSSTKSKQKFFTRFRQKMGRIFSLNESKESCCVLEFAAANEWELSEWFHMIVQSSCGDPCEEAHQDDLLKGMLWVTPESLTITNEIWFPDIFDVQVISCAQLKDVATLKIGELDEDFFIVIEFFCMEARSTSGDWILSLESREELMKLIFILEKYWNSNEKFPCEKTREERLLSHCRKFQGNFLENYWSPLLL